MAQLAGVSVATVSRVLNENANVSKLTKDKVLKAIKSLSYKPNFLGRNLRLQETKMILVMLNSITNNFYAKVIKGMEDVARNFGYNVLLCAMHDNKEIEQANITLLKNKMVDGIIFMSTTLNPKELKSLGAEFPIIQCSEYYENIDIPYISIDNEAASYDATCHLIKTGRSKIAHITVSNNSISTVLRLKGYKRALKEHNLRYDENIVIYGNYGYRSAYLAMEKLMSMNTKPDAVFAISDRMAAGAIKFSLDYGLKVPVDIAVCGFDNTDITYIFNPTITTISQNQEQMGKITMLNLINKIEGKTFHNKTILNHELIVRNSTVVL